MSLLDDWSPKKAQYQIKPTNEHARKFTTHTTELMCVNLNRRSASALKNEFHCREGITFIREVLVAYEKEQYMPLEFAKKSKRMRAFGTLYDFFYIVVVVVVSL